MSKIYVFPESIRDKAVSDSGFPFVSFEFVKRSLPENATVYLYLPPGFSVPDGAAYNNLDLGIIGNLNSDGTTSISDSDRKAIAREAKNKLLTEFGFASLAAQQKIKKGEAFNPNTVLQFDNVNIRSFNFQFKLVPESAKEAKQVRNIENLFRAALYPEKKNRLYLEYPPTFKIKFYHGRKENTYMPQIQECFLANITTTYNAGTNMFHADGAPSEVDMSLTFTETKANTRKDLYPDQVDPNEVDSGDMIDEVSQKINDKIRSISNIA